MTAPSEGHLMPSYNGQYKYALPLDNMDFFTALSLFRRKKYDECTAACTELLRKSPLDQVRIKYFYDVYFDGIHS